MSKANQSNPSVQDAETDAWLKKFHNQPIEVLATPISQNEAMRVFREYLTCHADACMGMSGFAMDEMALDLARIALSLQQKDPINV